MNEIMIFRNEKFGKIRSVVINGEVWFVGKNIGDILGYDRSDKALEKHVDEDDKLMAQIGTSGQNRNMYVINESGLYSLILSSKLPMARKFKRWVTSEVLPSIRKNGEYIKNQENLSSAEIVSNALIVANNIIENQKIELEELKPKGFYYDNLVSKNLCTNLRNTAKEIGLTEREFIRFLEDNVYLYRGSKGNLLPYAKEMTKELFIRREGINSFNNFPYVQTQVTPKGREHFLKILKCVLVEV